MSPLFGERVVHPIPHKHPGDGASNPIGKHVPFSASGAPCHLPGNWEDYPKASSQKRVWNGINDDDVLGRAAQLAYNFSSQYFQG